YIDGMRDLIGDTGRIYTTFNQTVTATGRLSSSDPNLQNIPVRTEEGRTIRALFEPGEGYDYLLSADYSQIELRILAHMSADERFIDAFVQNQDIHARTAAEVFNVPLNEVDSTLRRHAKAVNFGIVYGISDFGLAKDLHIEKKEAKRYIDNYFARYTGVKAFLDKTVEQAHQDGYVKTMFDRRRELAAINSRNFMQRSLAERMAMNTPIQGTAADIIKLAMISVYKELQAAGVKSRILLQVHDELVLEVVESEMDKVQGILKKAMEQVVKLSVPLLIDMHAGKNWAEAK
ncbi:MAG: DNA polymerase I, partial [Selenomonas sp.]|nr:DNA polymerase I [Selenomonas sp.]